MQILDQFGRPVNTKDLKTFDRARPLHAPKQDRFDTYPKRGITPARLDAIQREADMGYPARQVELFREIEEADGHVLSQAGTRRSAVARLNWELQPGGDDAKDLAAFEFCKEMLGGLQVDDLVEDLIEAALQGWSLIELFWDVSEGQAVITGAADIPQEYTLFDRQGIPRLATDDDPALGIVLPPLKTVFDRHRRKGKAARSGLMRTVSWWWLFKSFDTKDWLGFAEVFGFPLRVGKYPAGAKEDDKQALYRAVRGMGTDAAAIISDAMSIEFPGREVRTSGETVHERIFDKMDAQISKALLGQTMTADPGKTGSLAQAKVHDEVREDLRDSDAKRIQKTFDHQIFTPVTALNFGPGVRAPHLVFDLSEPEDKEKSVKVLKSAQEMGLPIPVNHAYRSLGIPAPESGDEVLPLPGDNSRKVKSKHIATGDVVMMANSSDAAANESQWAVDRLAELSLEDAGLAVTDLTGPLHAAIRTATNFEDAQRKVMWAYANMSGDSLSEVLLNAVFIAELNGLLSADSLEAPALAGVEGLSRPRIQMAGRMAMFNSEASPQFLDRPVQPVQAIQFFSSKLPLTPDQFSRLEAGARARAFTVAGVAEEDLLGKIFTGLKQSLRRGETFDSFRNRVDELFIRAGFEGPEPWHLRTVFLTNIQSAYQAGRYKGQAEAAGERPYLRYSAVGDAHTRPSHAAMDGRIYAANDPIWQSWYPPNGFNCRCSVTSLSMDEVTRRGLQVDADPVPGVEPDQGWDFNPGIAGWGRGLVEAALGNEANVRGWRVLGNINKLSDPAPEMPTPTPRPELPESPTALLRKLGSEDAVREHYREAALAALGMEAGPDGFIKDLPIADAVGDRAVLAGRMVAYDTGKTSELGRGRFVGLARDVVENADEVWLLPGESPDGRVTFRRRYLKFYEAAGSDAPVLAIAEAGRRVWETFNVYPKTEPANVRKGILIKK